jgi:hypothetical protein
MAAGSSKIGSLVWLVRLRHAQGLRYPTDVLLGTLILWVVLRGLGDSNLVWAIISFIVVSDWDVRVAWPNFVSRFANTLIGCVTGVIGLLIFGLKDRLLPLALALTSLVCTSVLRTSGSWKIVPATSALIITSGLVGHSVRRGVVRQSGCSHYCMGTIQVLACSC